MSLVILVFGSVSETASQDAAAEPPRVSIRVIEAPNRLFYRQQFDLLIEVKNTGNVALPRGDKEQLFACWETRDKKTGRLIRFNAYPLGAGKTLQPGQSAFFRYRAVVGPFEEPALRLYVGESSIIWPLPKQVTLIGNVVVHPLSFQRPQLVGEALVIRAMVGIGAAAFLAMTGIALLLLVRNAIRSSRKQESKP